MRVEAVPLLVALAACGSPPAASPRASNADGAQAAPAAETAQPAPLIDGVPVVHLDRIAATRPDPDEGVRNPFRLGVAAVPPRSVLSPEAGLPPRPVVPAEDGSSTPRPPALSLKFIGVVEAPESAGRVAVLSDGQHVYHGRQNEVIDGRYKILKIGVESIEIEILNGGGRRTIRLTGS